MGNAERYQRVKSVFLEACDLEPARIGEFLSRTCGDDPALRAEVEAMLHQDRRGDQPMGPICLGAADPLVALEPGASLGRYRIVQVIGEGGMGIVYEAEQDNPRRTVALKVIRPGLASPAMLRRFEHEAQALARLQHPGIAQIHEAGRADGPGGRVAFFAMERVWGVPLLEYAQRHGLGLRVRIELSARIADALQHAHQRGVIHRDLKPANILVDETGQPKVLDFGVARVMDEQPAATLVTTAGQIVGTVAYMSPEQAAGDPGAIDTRSDIYSLGVVIYELLSGRLPYAVTGVMLHEALRSIGQAEPARLSSVDRRLRGDVATILARALEKDRTRRYQACAEMAEDLRRHLRDEPILARPPTSMYQLRKFARRHKAVVAGATIAIAAMFIGTAVALRQASVAAAARRLAEDRSEAATRQAVRATIEAATVAFEQGDTTTVRRLLNSVSEDRRPWEWRYLAARVDTCEVLLDAGRPIAAAAVTPGGAEAVLVTDDGHVQRWRLAGSSRTSTIALSERPTGPVAITPDGSRLAGVFGDGGRWVGLWDTALGTKLAAVDSKVRQVRALAISPRGDRVAGGRDTSFLWCPETTGDGGLLPLHASGLHALAFSRDGRRLGSSYMEHILDYDSATGLSSHPARRLGLGFTGPLAMSDNGGWILASGGKQAVLCEAASGRRVAEFIGHAASVTAVEVEPGRARAVTGGGAGTVRVWDTASGARIASLPGSPAWIRLARFGNDSCIWAVSGSEWRQWHLPERDEIDTLRAHKSFVYAVAPLEDGRRIVSGSWDSTIRVWDSLTGEPLGMARCPGGTVISIAVLAPTAMRRGLIVTAHNSGLISVWDADTLAHVRDIRLGNSLRVASIRASGNGSRLAARQAETVVLFNTVDWTQAGSLAVGSPSDFSAVAISGDGAMVATDGPERSITLWQPDAGAPPRKLQGHTGSVFCVAFSPDGRTLASGAADSTVRLWNSADGTPIATLTGHTDRVYSLAYLPNGERLASGSNDTTVRVWDTRAADSVAVLRGHTDYVFSIAFTPDQARLLSGSGDGTVRIWSGEFARERWTERARMAARRSDAGPLLDGLFDRFGAWEPVAAAIRADPVLAAPQREAALQALLQRATTPPAP